MRFRPAGHSHSIGPMTAVVLMRFDDGSSVPLPADRWHGTCDQSETAVLKRVLGPVIDIGCGPGRHVEWLAMNGVNALGIDPSPRAVALASARGIPVIGRSVFDHLPGEGRWTTALLLDGNVGIGGDPVKLLRRVGDLLQPSGVCVAEVDGPDATGKVRMARLEVDGVHTRWFPWANLSVSDLEDVAQQAGSQVRSLISEGGRWFAEIVRI